MTTNATLIDRFRHGADNILSINPSLIATMLRQAADRIEGQQAQVERLTIDRDHYRAEATGATAQRVAELEHKLFSEQGSSANDRHEWATASAQHTGTVNALMHLLAEIEALDPDDTKLSKVQFRGAVRDLARRRRMIVDLPAEQQPLPGLEAASVGWSVNSDGLIVGLEAAPLAVLVTSVGKLMHPSTVDMVELAGKAMCAEYRLRDEEGTLYMDDLDDSQAGEIIDEIGSRLDPADPDGE